MTLTAYVRFRDTRETTLIARDDYKSKEAFWRELEANGFIVIRISNNRDLEAHNYNFVTFAAMKRWDKWTKDNLGIDSEYHEDIKRIEQIEL